MKRIHRIDFNTLAVRDKISSLAHGRSKDLGLGAKVLKKKIIMKYSITFHLVLTNGEQKQRHKIIIFYIYYNAIIYEKEIWCMSVR